MQLKVGILPIERYVARNNSLQKEVTMIDQKKKKICSFGLAFK